MKTVTILAVLAVSSIVAGCGSSMAAPAERLAATDAAIRSARELGAEREPQASLHLKLADDQAHVARNLMRNGENKRADLVLQRARSDAELAVMLVKERNARMEEAKAKQLLETAKGGK